jgi:WD40 repeat protein
MQALGTHNGAIHILDFNGNQVKVFHSHSATVNELSIDDSREYIASCSNDGKISSSQ